MDDEKLECKICARKFSTVHSIAAHIQKMHNLPNKIYYDTFLKKETEGICKKEGCCNETKYFGIKKGYLKYCSRKCSANSLEVKKNMSGSIKKTWTKERRKNRSKTSKRMWTAERREKQRNLLNNGLSKLMNSIERDPVKIKVESEKKRKKLLDGFALVMIKKIKKISKPELKLREMVEKMYSDCEFQYPILNFVVDMAIPKYRIAIEYDGYYHFDTEEHKQYHKQRQEKIEKEGWNFLRYNIFQPFPSSQQLKEDIQKIIRENY